MASLSKAAASGSSAEAYVKTGGAGVCSEVYAPNATYGTWSDFTSGVEATATQAAYAAGRVSVKLNGTEYYMPVFTTD